MPHSTLHIDQKGPILSVLIGISAHRREALKKLGHNIPPVVSANMLIDTGASMTCVDENIIKKLQIMPKGVVQGNTPSTKDTPHSFFTYDIEIIFPGDHSKIIPAIPVISSHFSSQGHDGLIGRDILAMARLIYSGPDNMAMLSII